MFLVKSGQWLSIKTTTVEMSLLSVFPCFLLIMKSFSHSFPSTVKDTMKAVCFIEAYKEIIAYHRITE